jgi:hypothetical protein
MTDGLRWWELKSGDRVRHFEYGAGTVDGAGPLWVYITWDDPHELLRFHTAAIVRYLELVRPPASGPDEGDTPRVHEVV